MLMRWWEWGRPVVGPELCDTDEDRPRVTLQIKVRNWGFSPENGLDQTTGRFEAGGCVPGG